MCECCSLHIPILDEVCTELYYSHHSSFKLQFFRDMGFIPVEQGSTHTKLLVCKLQAFLSQS